MNIYDGGLLDTACDILVIVAFRCLPFAIYLALSASVGVCAKLAVVASYLAVVAGAMAIDPLSGVTVVSALVALAYFAALTVGVHTLSAIYAARRADKAALFVLLATAFVLVPSLLVPGPRSVDAQLLGWDLMFSGYSYCIDASRMRERPSLRECAFFMLVNPTYVFAERGERTGPPAVSAAALRRALGGIAWIALHRVVLAAPLIISARLLSATAAPRLVHALHLSTQALSTYFAHYGSASLVIGLMAMLGHRVPERYEQVYLARSPADFWRRWNTYLGHWARRYVFTPLAVVVPRKLRRLPLRLGIAVALLTTFAFVGLMHDYVLFAQSPSVPTLPWGSLFFGVQALWLLAWVAASKWRPPLPRALATAGSRLLLWVGLIYSSALYFAAA